MDCVAASQGEMVLFDSSHFSIPATLLGTGHHAWLRAFVPTNSMSRNEIVFVAA